MTETVTYGQLYDKLRALGFAEQTFSWNGGKRRYFKHLRVPNASVVLPDAPAHESAETMYVLAVRSMLFTHGLLKEPDIVPS